MGRLIDIEVIFEDGLPRLSDFLYTLNKRTGLNSLIHLEAGFKRTKIEPLFFKAEIIEKRFRASNTLYGHEGRISVDSYGHSMYLHYAIGQALLDVGGKLDPENEYLKELPEWVKYTWHSVDLPKDVRKGAKRQFVFFGPYY